MADWYEFIQKKTQIQAHDQSIKMRTQKKCGLRVNITYTFSASGTMAPILISVLGLTERYLPKETISPIKTKDICVGEVGLNVGSQQYGIIIFMISENAMYKKRYQIYRD